MAAQVALAASADALFRKGWRAQRQGRNIEAYILYSRARALDPTNLDYIRAAESVRRGAAQLLAAAGEHRMALEMAPDSWEFQASRDPLEASPQIAGMAPRPQPPRLPAAPKALKFADQQGSFRFRGTLREAYEEVGARFGVRIVFHDEFGSRADIRADLTECDFRCAMRALGEIEPALLVPLDDDLLFVAEDSPGNRSQFETAALASIPLASELTPDQVSEVAQALQQVLDIKSVQSVTASGLLLRASPTKIRMARLLAQDLLHPRGSARIEVVLLADWRDGRTQAGINLPSSFPIANFSSILGNTATAGGSSRMIGLGGGKTTLGVTVGDASLVARSNASSAQSIYASQLRSAHGTAAEFRVGERYPIVTAQYSTGSGTGAPGAGSDSFVQPPPSITFEDLGLNLSVTPLIHSARSVSLELEVNFRFLAGSAVNGIPVLANREFSSQVRLDRGEFAIVSGMAVYERQRTAGGIAGLGQVPVLGALFRRNEWRWSRRDLLILVRPTVVRLPPAELARTRLFLFGTEERPAPVL